MSYTTPFFLPPEDPFQVLLRVDPGRETGGILVGPFSGCSDLWASLLGDSEFWICGILASRIFRGSVLLVESVLWVFGSLGFAAWGFGILGLLYSG